MKYFIIAGEASGDLHASHLMSELKKQDLNADFKYFGGDLMKAHGGSLLKHYSEMAFMGLVNVLKNLSKIKKNFRLAEKELLEYAPDVLILVDYPGFNLRMAAFAKKHGIKTFYYISPKIWAWNTRRVKKVKKFVDEMFTIFPFETDFYKKYNYPIHFVGNPTVDELIGRPNKDETFEQFIGRNDLPDKKVISLLAGSRKQEISSLLPIMAEVAENFSEYQFVIAGAPSQSADFYKKVLGDRQIPVVFDQTYELLQQSDAALVASGTATLEAAIINIPQAVCYKIEFGKFGKWLVRDVIMNVPYISLVNLILNREAVKELFQEACNVDSVSLELRKILDDKVYRGKMLDSYVEMKEKLGGEGSAERAAKKMIELLTVL
jgi:lipid-A-disaccharide synthase